jgi:hypothetical protein
MNNTNNTNDDLDNVDDEISQAALQQGRTEGKEAGEQAGYQEGRTLGQSKGVELGMEIGFAMGLLQAVQEWLEQTRVEQQQQQQKETQDIATVNSLEDVRQPSSTAQDTNAPFISRIQKSVDELARAILDFPSVQELFHETPKRSEDHETETTEKDTPSALAANKSTLSNPATPIDVRAKMQRIHARCKVLTAKLGIPYHSLKSVLQQEHSDPLESSLLTEHTQFFDNTNKKNNKKLSDNSNEW